MERGRKAGNFFEKQGYRNLKKRIFISVIIILIALFLFYFYFIYIYTKPCNDKQCFYSSLNDCKRVSWTKEDDQAAWVYKNLGKDLFSKKDLCRIEVQLLKMKKGTIDAEKLEGKKMSCSIPKNYEQYPEKDISRCTGLLKEEMQDVLIKRMHDYLLKNIGEIKEEFKA